MLVLLNFDSASVPLLERLVAEGRLPAVADLLGRGRRYPLRSPATYFPAGAYPTLYTGLELADHGLYYPFQWDAAAQRSRYVETFPSPATVWERVSEAGARSLVVDPYESRPPRGLRGLWLCGWQFRNRVVLPPRSRPEDANRRLQRRLGRSPSVEEVFGTQSRARLEAMRRALLAAPGRVARLARHLLRQQRFDLLWLTFSAAHLAGHQFWDLSQFPDTQGLERTLPEVYERVDEAIGEILGAVGDDADVVLFAVLGMGPDTSRVDLLPGMLGAVLGGRPAEAGPGTVLWRLRDAIPTGVRASVADRLPRRAVLDLTARLETRAPDWSGVRAFVLASDVVGYIRFNLRGREREGVVEPDETDALSERIATGLATFADPDGTPSITRVERRADVVADGPCSQMLPDLVVRWSDRPSIGLDRVVSPQYGEVRRAGRGSGRSGNHVDDAWTVVVPGRAREPEDRPAGNVVDLAATVCAALGAETTGLPGRSLLLP
ncbi:MAG TPA: alkaline phosphatase family protein [Gaiellaceae bacterium]|nr:alkaline phosphatase family protein [Gaiellaceae bacterium]